jgi:hypothetical protein
MSSESAKLTCSRLFEVEAVRDGRLTGAELTRFQNHVRGCSVCAEELSAMEGLASALRSTTPPTADELHVRRERMRLLAAFDASLVPAPKQTHGKLWLGALAALAAVATLTLLRQPSRSVTAIAARPEAVMVQADTTTQWSRRAEIRQEIIKLESGTLSIHVDHRLSHRRLLVLLPDGELEDIGTTFSVTAASAHTTSVTVQDGSVILRLRGLPALTLRAGDAWSPAPAELSSAPAFNEPPPRAVLRGTSASASAAAPATNLSASAAAPATSLSALAAAPAPNLSASAATVAPASARSDPAADFRAAMSAFTSGDNARASSLFAAFLRQHPRDPRGEDAAYLRVLTLQRSGDSIGMKKAAGEYLVRYPRGFRHAEVEPLSR